MCIRDRQIGVPSSTTQDAFGGVVAIGQDFYTGVTNVGADYASIVNPSTFTSEEPVESKSAIFKVQDAAIEQAYQFAFDRPEFERLSKEGNLPLDSALSKASKVAPAQLAGEVVTEAGLWIGTAGAGRVIWGVGRGVKLSHVAAKTVKKGTATAGPKGKIGIMQGLSLIHI